MTRALPAPNTDGLVRPPALLSVRIEDEEDVQWQWTHLIDGRSVITGYRIVNRMQLLDTFKRRFDD